MRIKRTIIAAATAVGALTATSTLVYAMSFGAWSPAVNAESIDGTSVNLNTAALEGCAFVAQRDDILYFASDRPRSAGDTRTDVDIWYSLRGENGAWGDPVNFTAVNTAANELCPAAHRNGKTFLFVRSSGICGGEDIFMTRLHAKRGWAEPTNLGCTVNSAGNEASPSLVGNELYFSRTPIGGSGDIYVSTFDGASFGEPALVQGLNTVWNDSRPNLRRDGLEIFFESNRNEYCGASRNLDLWTSTRTSTSDLWSDPKNLGCDVNSGANSGANDLRATLSWDGTTLYFNSNRVGGQQDIYVTTREK